MRRARDRHRGWALSALMSVLVPACVVAPGDWPSESGSVGEPLDTVGFYPGRGYFFNQDSVASDCLVPAGYPTDPKLIVEPVRAANTGGQEVIFSLSKVETSQEIQDKLDINASASAKFLVAGGSAKFGFAQETKVDDNSVTLLASVIVRNTSWTVPPGVKLHPDAAALLGSGALTRFRERCGDGFLQSYTTGGEFHAFIQVQTSSREEKEVISAAVQGNYLSISGSAEFNSKMQSIVKNSTTIVKSYQIGGFGIDIAPCLDVPCVADRVSKFTTAVAQNPVVFAAEVAKYQVLTLPTDAKSPLDVSVAQDTMTDLNIQRNATRDLLDKLIAAQSRPERYALDAPNATLAQVTTAISTLNGNLTLIDSALKSCWRDYTLCSLPALSNVGVQAPPAKPANPSWVLFRSYDSPSEYLTPGLFMTATAQSPCGGEFAQANANDYRADLTDNFAFNVMPGWMPNLGSKQTFSFTPASQPNHYLTVSNMRDSCGHSLKLLTGPLTGQPAKVATFFIEPGLNGKPNTVSLRLYYDPADPLMNNTAPATVVNSHQYVRYQRDSRFSVEMALITDTSSAATKDSASWYLEAP